MTELRDGPAEPPRHGNRRPRYDELPAAERGGRSGWGLFGSHDSVGLLNMQSAETILAAAGLVRKGMVFPLDAPLDAVDPPLDSDRGIPRHRVLHAPGAGLEGLDDVFDNFYPQASSHSSEWLWVNSGGWTTWPPTARRMASTSSS